MPIIEIHLMEGRTVSQKRALIAGITDAVVTALDVGPETVRILIDELLPEHFAVSGKTTAEQRSMAQPKTNGAAKEMGYHEEN